jgi:excinuclease ABC subunit A
MLVVTAVKPNAISCKGKRLRIEASYVKINSKTVSDLVDLPIKHLVTFSKESIGCL